MLRRLSLVLVALPVGVALALFATGWLLTRPVPARVGPPPPDLGARGAQFASESGAQVKGWWCPVSESRGSILLLPGVRANRLSMVERARFLRAAGFAVLLIDFQATGETRGDHITFGWLESRDAQAAVAFLHATVPEGKIGVIGSSLGGAAALLATPPLRVDAMVLESVYPTIEQATANRLRKYLGRCGEWLVPVLLAETRFLIGVAPEQLHPADRIGSLSCPVLIINGDADQNTTRHDAAQLFGGAKPPKEFWLIPNAGHQDLLRVEGDAYKARILGFLNHSMRAPVTFAGSALGAVKT